MKGALLSLLLLAGCDRLFALQSVDTSRDAQGLDADMPLDVIEPSDDSGVDAMVATDAPTASCPGDYSTVGGLRVRLSSTFTTWSLAEQDCADDTMSATIHTHLVVYTNDVQRGMVGAFTGSAFWIGYSDRAVEGQYQWVTNEPNVYPAIGDMPWAGNEPSADEIDDDCVLQRGVDDWDTVPCSGNQAQFMCECDTYPADSTKL